MKTFDSRRTLFPRQFVFILLASAFALSASAQKGQTTSDQQTMPDQMSAPASMGQQPSPAQQPSPMASEHQPSPALTQVKEPKEGFWGRVNPFARKKWVNDRVEPIKGQLNELDEVNARNAQDIRDLDARARAGIRNAQSSADQANQMAMNAGNEAQNARATAQGASGHVDRLNTTVNGLDQYKQATALEIPFRGGQPILHAAAKKQLDDFAANLTGRKGYIVEVEGYSPMAGNNGIQSSRRLTEAVNRYLVIEHEIPVYRLRAVALGNAPVTAMDSDSDETKPVKVSCVRIRLMENTLAAQEDSSPHDATSATGAEERP
jgi:outer membrane protein OmpA-like peptidoglycan-associated protein